MTEQTTILVTGADGQLGNEFRVLASDFPAYRFLFTGSRELPVDDHAAVQQYFKEHQINYCINCAAYTAVDKAETEVEEAFRVNADAAGNLAAVCRSANTQLIHISTDYVFDGKTDIPYKEDDKVNTINVYGASKLKGEALALQNDPSVMIIRSSWVYGAFGNNFVKTMLRLMKEKDSLNVVNDQQGAPTYAADLAAAILEIIAKTGERNKLSGIFHYANQGVISWFEFAAAIAELTKSNCIVHPIPTTSWPTPAMRPEYSVLDTRKIKETFHITIPQWKESLERCLQLLK